MVEKGGDNECYYTFFLLYGLHKQGQEGSELVKADRPRFSKVRNESGDR